MNAPTKIRWIAFDAVGTLIAPDPPVATVYYQIGRRHGSQLATEEVNRRFRDAISRSADQTSSEATERQFWRSLVGQILDDTSDRERCFTELHEWFASPSAWRCFDDVAPALETFHEQGYRLAFASNFDERLHAVRRGLPELKRIDRCVVSSEAGWRKPHTGFYAALIKACSCKPEQILMVGDDLANDVAGAEQAGLQAVWLDRHAVQVENRPYQRTIRSLVELSDRMASLESSL